VAGVDPSGDTENEVNSCVLSCVDYEQVITQHPCCYHILGSLPLPPRAVLTVSFNLDSNFKPDFYVNPKEKKLNCTLKKKINGRWNERV